VRISGGFSKSKGVPEQKSLGNTDLGDFVAICVMEYVTASVEQTPYC